LVGATRSLSGDGDMKKLHGDPTNGPHTKAWTNGQRWKK